MFNPFVEFDEICYTYRREMTLPMTPDVALTFYKGT